MLYWETRAEIDYYFSKLKLSAVPAADQYGWLWSCGCRSVSEESLNGEVMMPSEVDLQFTRRINQAKGSVAWWRSARRTSGDYPVL